MRLPLDTPELEFGVRKSGKSSVSGLDVDRFKPLISLSAIGVRPAVKVGGRVMSRRADRSRFATDHVGVASGWNNTGITSASGNQQDKKITQGFPFFLAH